MHVSVLTYNTLQYPFLKIKVLPLIVNVKFRISPRNDSFAGIFTGDSVNILVSGLFLGGRGVHQYTLKLCGCK